MSKKLQDDSEIAKTTLTPATHLPNVLSIQTEASGSTVTSKTQSVGSHICQLYNHNRRSLFQFKYHFRSAYTLEGIQDSTIKTSCNEKHQKYSIKVFHTPGQSLMYLSVVCKCVHV